MPTPHDGELLRAFRAQGDEDAFAELVRRHGGTVLAATRAFVGQLSVAEDIVQTAFLLLARKAPRLENATSLAGWLYHAAACLARNERRNAARRQAREKEAVMLAGDQDAPPAIAEADRTALHEELAKLPERDRDPLVLHHLEGLSYEAAAAALGCNPNTFGPRLTRAREKLRQRLVARGFALGADGLGGVFEEEGATSVALPAAFVAATCQAASLLAAGKTLTGTGLVSAQVAYLTKSALKTLFWAKVKTAAAAVVLTAGVVGGGLAAAVTLGHRPPAPAMPTPAAAVPALVIPAPAQGARVYAWGQLGDGTTDSRLTPVLVRTADETASSGIAAVDAGENHTVELRRDGSVWTWAAARRYGPGKPGSPVQVTLADATPLSEIAAVAAGLQHTVALKRDGSVWGWGKNMHGELGDGTTTRRSGAAPVRLPDGVPLGGIMAIAAGQEFTLALKQDGSVWAWGDNYRGQLGCKPAASSPPCAIFTPRQVQMPDGAALPRIVAIACGQSHAVALTAAGQLMTWGGGGTGDRARYAPVMVRLPDGSPLSDVTALAAGVSHTVALRSDGSLWAWGSNDFGQLGDGTTTHREYPVPVAGSIRGVVSMAAGFGHTVALTRDGQVWAWGMNVGGQLGDGTITQRLAPVRVIGLSEVVSITAGSWHTVAIAAAQRPVVEAREESNGVSE